MPTTTSTVGGTTIPVVVGAANSAVDDPVLVGLLSWFGQWIQNSLSGQLAVMGGPDASGAFTDACPAANRYAFNPETTWVRNGFPALYCWQESSVHKSWTMVYDMRERGIRLLYVFGELIKPDGYQARNGVLNAVDATIAKACWRGLHPSFAAGTDAAGTPILQSLSLSALDYVSSEIGFLEAIPGGSDRAGGSGDERKVQRGYPALRVLVTVRERVNPDDLSANDAKDIAVHLETNELGDLTNTMPILDGVLPADDGTENP